MPIRSNSNISPNSSYAFSKGLFGKTLAKLTVGDSHNRGDSVLSNETRHSRIGRFKFDEPSEMAEIQEHALIVLSKSPEPMNDLEWLKELLQGVENDDKGALKACIKVMTNAAKARQTLIKAGAVDSFEFTQEPTNR